MVKAAEVSKRGKEKEAKVDPKSHVMKRLEREMRRFNDEIRKEREEELQENCLLDFSSLLEIGYGKEKIEKMKLTLKKRMDTKKKINKLKRLEYKQKMIKSNNDVKQMIDENDTKKVFKKIKPPSKDKQSLPDKLIVDGETSVGKDVIDGFIKVTISQSGFARDKVPGNEPDPDYMKISDIVDLLKYLNEEEDSHIRHMTMEEFKDIVASLGSKKAVDIYGLSKEHFMYMTDDVAKIFLTLINELLSNLSEYSSTHC